MGRSSTRENKTRYQLAREELGLSRERAAELLETILIVLRDQGEDAAFDYVRREVLGKK